MPASNDRYVDHLSAQQLARVEALHVARGVLQSTGFMTSHAGAAPDGLIDVAEYIVQGVTETVRTMIRTDDGVVDARVVDNDNDEPWKE
ncbi:hypothetical protein SEA_GALADRIEL_50 [Gordonia phage Galadriel]|uniref:Uncharacterized protein n=3 Tax=Vividuovirus TaxID=2560251 RepID=A0A3G3M9L6_9CAUD|nr:hypothetical protein KNU21_gp45 [Gordonia phage Nordenberg]YP_010102878.1 hypothetical protein KNU61_gp50 [Gordonia phage Galadriel]YP_010109507.1 hypothetical protein KNV17_gp53 [Gordonia phage Paries]AYR03109.1 hypothetical protein SEA_NORDENBERG_45 [Gordonia phage Nordenberg]QDH92069.1 hypothetical protein SEA_GALADRIEL_50 [Gordonia phage Galadriel]QNJ55456.1 hypothetical protein SEA_PARIES_53 [Gordonia phage Paries]